jgi:hypothetical protein
MISDPLAITWQILAGRKKEEWSPEIRSGFLLSFVPLASPFG